MMLDALLTALTGPAIQVLKPHHVMASPLNMSDDLLVLK